jgi:hypothetical protein
MAIIANDTQFIGIAPSIDLNGKKSALLNAQTEPVTMADIADTVASSVSSNPQVIDLKVTDGTVVTGTTVGTISQSLLIPANTFTSAGGMLEFIARFQKTGTAGNQSTAVLLNTSVSFSGATTIASFTISSSNTYVQAIRTARVASNTLTIYPSGVAGVTDYVGTPQPQTSVAFDPTVDNYLLFVIYLINGADSSVVEMARATKYE